MDTTFAAPRPADDKQHSPSQEEASWLSGYDLAICDHAQCALYKQQFETKYRRYTELDVELSHNTAEFEEMMHKLSDVAREEQIAALWLQKEQSILPKVEEYRALHVDLKRIKAAVNRYIDEQMQLRSRDSSG